MSQILWTLYNDEAGFIVSAEMVLIATVAVLSLVVGLSEVSHGVNQELEDVGSAFGALQQSYVYRGLGTRDKATMFGSYFQDHVDLCDSQFDVIPTAPRDENGGQIGGQHGHHGE
ncbi:branched-chain amino acid aminotransferase [bacterium]|nr:branched-chain amino acid aminotransferase [bacterium]